MKRVKCTIVKPKPEEEIDHALETTLAIIKPDGMPYRQDILQIIMKSGFQIIQRHMVRLSPEQASDFYKDKSDLKSYNLMVLSLSEGPIEALVLAKENCIEDWKTLMGPERTRDAVLCFPESIRGMFGTCSDDERNVVHGSENERHARFEIHYFFPNFIIEPIRQEDANKLCCETVLMATLFDGLYKVSEARPFDPVTWLAQWLLQNNPLKPIINEACGDSEAKLQQIKEVAAATGKKVEYINRKAYSRVSSSSISSSAISVLCSCLPTSSSSAEQTPRNVHDKMCSCNLVLKPNDITFCPICHKTMKFRATPTCDGKGDGPLSSSSHAVTVVSSTSVETQTESSSDLSTIPSAARSY